MCKYYVRVNIHECVCVCVCIFVWGSDSRDPQSLQKDQSLDGAQGRGKAGWQGSAVDSLSDCLCFRVWCLRFRSENTRLNGAWRYRAASEKVCRGEAGNLGLRGR